VGPAQIPVVGTDGFDEALQLPKYPGDVQQSLHRHAGFPGLQPTQAPTIDAGALGDLLRRQSEEAAPRAQVDPVREARAAECTATLHVVLITEDLGVERAARRARARCRYRRARVTPCTRAEDPRA
jgi:hypothetical protein